MFTVRVSVDTLEQEALALVSEAGVLYGRLPPVLTDLDAAQVATGDGCRTLSEWVASRLDVTHVRVIVEDEPGIVVAVSSRSRAIPSATRAAVLRRDLGVCTVDGCRSRYRLQPHHIRPYSDGGDHQPSNLTTLC